jgi:hypothetical protein
VDLQYSVLMLRAFALALIAWAHLQGAQGIAPRTVVALRFHHLHYAVGDPSSAIDHVVQATGGTRLLVPGLGAGVRIGNEFVLFDRLVEAQSSGTDAAAVQASYRATVLWLRRRGIPAIESATGGARLAAFVGAERLDHIGFVADDLSRAVRALEEAGAAPLRRSDDAALFKIPGGARIEIVRHTAGVWGGSREDAATSRR